MAAFGDESCLDLGDFDAESVMKLQALWRGWLVRKKLKDAQAEFVNIVGELDGPAVTVEWQPPHSLHPVISKLSKKQREMQVKRQSSIAALSQEGDGVSDRDNNKFVQTSFVETWSRHGSDRGGSAGTQEKQTENNEFTGTNGKNCHLSKENHRPQTRQPQTDTSEETDTFDETHQKGRSRVPGCAGDATDHHSDLGNGHKKVRSFRTEREKTATSDFYNEKHDRRYGAGTENVTDRSHTSERAYNASPVESASDSASNSVNITPDPVTVVVTGTSQDAYSESRGLQGESSDFSSSAVSPAMERNPGIEGTSLHQETASRLSGKARAADSFHGDQTSVWDSSSSILTNIKAQHHKSKVGSDSCARETSEDLRRRSTEELVKQRQNVAMELLWVQQAIISRKKYLKLKSQMDTAA